MRKILFILLTLLSVMACTPPVETPPPTPQPGDSAEMVLVGYFMGESNLIGSLRKNMTQMELAVADGALGNKGRILIFLDSSTGGGIYELYNTGSGATSRMVKNYETIDSADPEIMCSIMNDIKALAPSNHYGLVIGCHGNGWVRKELNLRDMNNYGSDWSKYSKKSSDRRESAEEHQGLWDKYYQPGDWKTRVVGYDVNRWMDIPELAVGIRALQPDFVLFDACSMANIEALWDLRGTTRYVIASAAEVMIDGFPYRPITALLFADWNDLSAVCEKYVSTYLAERDMPHATVALVDMNQLDGVGEAVSKVLSSSRKVEWEWLNDVDTLQYYEGLANHVFYDLGDCMARVATDSMALAEFERAMESAVIWEGHTPTGYSDYNHKEFTIKRSSGLSIYISREMFPKFAEEYAETQWAKDVGIVESN